MDEPTQSTKSRKIKRPAHPIISDSPVKPVAQQDTLDRVASILALLQELQFSDGISANADAGLYWILAMLESTVKHISDSLAADN